MSSSHTTTPGFAAAEIGHVSPATAAERADLVVVVPAFDEASGVGLTIDGVRAALAATGRAFSIVVVDDGSTDGTGDEARRHGADVITLPENRGYGAALKAGIVATSADLVAIIDADGTYPPAAVRALAELTASADMVVGARASDDRSIPTIRRPAKWIIARLAEYLAERKIPDINSGLRVMRRSALEPFLSILPDGFSFTTTITLAMMCNGYRVVYEPVQCTERVGTSKIRPRHFMKFVMLVLRTVVLFNPLRVFLPLGMALFLVGLGKFVYDVTLWNLSETAVMGFLSAIVVWSVGLLADLIARLQLRPPRPPS